MVKSGVERIYAVTGDSLNEVNEAVRKNDQIKWIHVRHEETGAYAAAAEAQLTYVRDAAREVADRDTFILSTVCMTRTVPGTGNRHRFYDSYRRIRYGIFSGDEYNQTF